MSNENETESESTAQAVEVMSMGAIESVERAQIDVQIATARRYPRTLSKVKSDMMSLATLDEETAAACFYTLPRGGKSIQGPSVRLAEIALSCFGNARSATRVIAEVADGPTPHVMIQSVCFDLERNIAVSIEKRRRITKKKTKATPDEDDINLAVNAGAAIAYRDAVFKVVPLALVKPVLEAAKKCAVGDVKSLVAQRSKVVDRLKQMGVTEDRILLAVECRKVEDIDLDKLGTLIGLGTSIKDGNTTIEDAFPFPPHPGMTPQTPQPAGTTSTATTKLAAAEEKKTESKAAEKPAETAPPQQAPPAAATDPDEAAAQAEAEEIRKKNEAKARAEAQAAKPSTPPAESQPATAATKPVKPPPFNKDVHIPMMREKLKGLGIGIAQLSGYMVNAYRIAAFTNLAAFSEQAPTMFQNMLYKNLEKLDVLAKIRALPGAMTVEG